MKPYAHNDFKFKPGQKVWVKEASVEGYVAKGVHTEAGNTQYFIKSISYDTMSEKYRNTDLLILEEQLIDFDERFLNE